MRSEVQVLLDPPTSLGDINGALAQLGERLICIQEVSGSIPLGSTITHVEEHIFKQLSDCLNVCSSDELTSFREIQVVPRQLCKEMFCE